MKALDPWQVASEKFDCLGIFGQWTDHVFAESGTSHGVDSDRQSADCRIAECASSHGNNSYRQTRKREDADCQPSEGEEADGKSAKGKDSTRQAAQGEYAARHITDCEEASRMSPGLVIFNVGAKSYGNEWHPEKLDC